MQIIDYLFIRFYEAHVKANERYHASTSAIMIVFMTITCLLLPLYMLCIELFDLNDDAIAVMVVLYGGGIYWFTIRRYNSKRYRKLESKYRHTPKVPVWLLALTPALCFFLSGYLCSLISKYLIIPYHLKGIFAINF